MPINSKHLRILKWLIINIGLFCTNVIVFEKFGFVTGVITAVASIGTIVLIWTLEISEIRQRRSNGIVNDIYGLKTLDELRRKVSSPTVRAALSRAYATYSSRTGEKLITGHELLEIHLASLETQKLAHEWLVYEENKSLNGTLAEMEMKYVSKIDEFSQWGSLSMETLDRIKAVKSDYP